MLPVATILHPTDFSEHSEVAFRLACALARDYDARLVLLHVTLPPIIIYGEGGVAPEPWVARAEAKEKMQKLEAQAHHGRVESLVMEGDPVEMILRAAKETKSDVIVLGTHGRAALSRLLLGSVAEAVLRQAPCPVLTVKSLPRRKPAGAGSTSKRENRATVETAAK